MKALILAAGLGTRLRPHTEKIPKVMIDVGDKPLLWYHIQNLKYYGIKDLWINLYWFPEVVKNFFGDGSRFGVKISYSVESPDILGTAGALKNPNSNIEKELGEETFLVVYGDNLTDFDYSKLIEFHKSKQSIISLGLYSYPEPWTKGLVETDQEGKVLRFVEKPPKDQITTNEVNAGIYICEKEILDDIPKGFSDFGFDVFPKLMNEKQKVYALNTHDYFQDIGTLEGWEKAKNDLEQGKLKFKFKI